VCGITGVLGAHHPIVGDLNDALRHRGPDGSGVHHRGALQLGSRRLAVVDLDHGSQPIYDETGRICLVANGEIYNHAELRAGLLARGHRFAGGSDVEVILHLYEEYGADCVEHLDGMFAFALADGDRLLLARDRYGIKPLYYTLLPEAGLLVFASEIKALLRCPQVRPAIDRQAFADLLVVGYPVDGRTMLDGVRAVPPGHVLTATSWRDVQVRPYRSGAAASPVADLDLDLDFGLDFDEAQDRLVAALRGAVASHLTADVEVGLMLSGGLDSTLLAVLAREIAGDGLRTFAVADRAAHPDARHAERVAAELGTRHETTLLGFDDYLAAVPAAMHALEHPSGLSGTPLVTLAATVSRRLKVCLSGEGADELFGGYPEYLDPRTRLRSLPARLAAIGALGLSLSPRAAEIVDGWAAQPFDRYLDRVFTDNLREQLVAQHLEPLDRAGMASGVEVRVPYLDGGVADLVRSLPPGYRVDPALKIQKHLLKRAALRHFPQVTTLTDAVLRHKIGAPGAFWRHQQALGRLCDETLPANYRSQHEFGRCLPDNLALVMVELFEEIFVRCRGTLPDDLTLPDFLRSRAGVPAARR
jgi:asparagine synthase (glutamine-hydrolysing)